MRRRHLRGVLRIEAQVAPRPWTSSLFLSELALRSSRAYFVARVGRDIVGYGGLMMTLDDGSAAKSLALVTGRPYVGVNHHEGHMYAALLDDPTLEPPFVTLVASGGHTLLVAMRDHGRYETIGQTVDDAAGE